MRSAAPPSSALLPASHRLSSPLIASHRLCSPTSTPTPSPAAAAPTVTALGIAICVMGACGAQSNPAADPAAAVSHRCIVMRGRVPPAGVEPALSWPRAPRLLTVRSTRRSSAQVACHPWPALHTLAGALFIMLFPHVRYPVLDYIPVSALAGVMIVVVIHTFKWVKIPYIVAAALPGAWRPRVNARLEPLRRHPPRASTRAERPPAAARPCRARCACCACGWHGPRPSGLAL